MFKKFFNYLTSDLAIDLGTANTVIYEKGHGIVCFEPSVVAVEKLKGDQNKVLAVGKEAKEMIGKTPENVFAIRPMKDGVIADFDITSTMLKYFIRKVQKNKRYIRPRIIICIPYGITDVEKRAVKESAISAGARDVYLIEEPMAAAIGAGLPVTEASGSMIIDIGGGTTEIAVISLSGIVESSSIRVGGNKFDECIIQYVKKKYNLLIGDKTAESIKIAIGSALPVEKDGEPSMQIKGRDLVSGIPKTISISTNEICESIIEPIKQIVEATKRVLERTPPELASDIVDKGIVLSGGGALLQNMDEVIRRATNLPVSIAEDPLASVVLGSGMVLENATLLNTITLNF